MALRPRLSPGVPCRNRDLAAGESTLRCGTHLVNNELREGPEGLPGTIGNWELF